VESENLQGPVVAVADSTDAEHLYDIHEQQVKVTKAKGAYDKARAVYTGQVLAGFVRSGGARLKSSGYTAPVAALGRLKNSCHRSHATASLVSGSSTANPPWCVTLTSSQPSSPYPVKASVNISSVVQSRYACSHCCMYFLCTVWPSGTYGFSVLRSWRTTMARPRSK
jgi:hypothetical protein